MGMRCEIVVFILLAIVVKAIFGEPTSMQSRCSPDAHVCMVHVVTLTKAPQHYSACWRQRVSADCEAARAPSLSQAFLLFLRRGASSHALFEPGMVDMHNPCIEISLPLSNFYNRPPEINRPLCNRPPEINRPLYNRPPKIKPFSI